MSSLQNFKSSNNHRLSFSMSFFQCFLFCYFCFCLKLNVLIMRNAYICLFNIKLFMVSWLVIVENVLCIVCLFVCICVYSSCVLCADSGGKTKKIQKKMFFSVYKRTQLSFFFCFCFFSGDFLFTCRTKSKNIYKMRMFKFKMNQIISY